MTTLTAVAGGGQWGTAGTWSPAQVPTAADDCIIGSGMTGTVTINGTSGSPSLCRSLDCTGCTHTLAQGTNAVLNIGDGSGGSLTLAAGMTYAPSGSSTINFVSTTTGNSITTAGKTLASVNFNGAGGGWTLQDNLTASVTLALTSGNLNDNGKAVSTFTFLSDNSNARTLTMSGSWTVKIWTVTNSTGMTLTAAGSTITFSAGNADFQGGGLSYGSVILHPESDALFGANTFENLTVTGGADMTDTLTLAANQTITGTLTISGNSVLNRILVQSDTKGVIRTLATAANSISNADFRDITGTGASGWNLSAITGGSGDCGNNSGITFTSPMNCYMKASGSVDTSASNWYTTSGGSTPARVPLPQDMAIFDVNSVIGLPITITQNMPRFGGVDFTGFISNSTFALGTGNNALYGSVTFVTPHLSVSGTLTMAGGSSTTLTWAGHNNSLIVDCDAGTVTLQDAMGGGPGTLEVTSGTFDGNGQTISRDGVTVDGGIFILGGTLSLNTDASILISAGTLDMNGQNITGVNLTTTIKDTGTLNLSGQFQAGAISVQGGTINDTGPAGELVGTTAHFTGGNATVRKLTLSSSFTQSGSSSLTIVESATWHSSWTWSGTAFTFTTSGTPTWTAGTLTVVSGGGGNGGSWTFC